MISATILTKNSSKYLKDVLTALSSFEEILVYDNGSTDDTMDIARTFPNVVIREGKFLGFGITHNTASQLAKYDWILSIDSDEVVTQKMIDEIKNTTLDPNSVYSFNRHNYYNGKLIKWCGWYPDHVIRLYNRRVTRFTDSQVHEVVNADNLNIIHLNGIMNHYPYSSISDFLAKMDSYSELFALQNQGKKSTSIVRAIGSGLFAFFRFYIFKKGFLGGFEGLLISSYMANTAFYKYIKLYEKNKRMKSS